MSYPSYYIYYMDEPNGQGELPDLACEDVELLAQVPADFLSKARSAGYSPEKLLWQLAENFCVHGTTKIRVVKPPRKALKHGRNEIRFPLPFRAA